MRIIIIQYLKKKKKLSDGVTAKYTPASGFFAFVAPFVTLLI